jgi:tRNA(Ile)-lysidine synthase
MRKAEGIFFRVKEFVVKHGLIKKDETVLLALSGGGDSVCLLHLLIDLQKIIPFVLRAVHVNHLLRAAESQADETFCRKLCIEKKISLSVRKVSIASLARTQKVSVEVAGRNERYRILEVLRKKTHADKIALAHHAGDQAETMCMRFFKGSMWEGLSAIKPLDSSLIRPLLLLQKEEILNYLRWRNISWREDASNVDDRFMRNAIRNRLIPMIQEHVNPNVVQTLADKAEYFREASHFINRQIDRFWKKTIAEKSRKFIHFKKSLSRHEKFIRLAMIHAGLKQLSKSLHGISLRHLEAVDDEITKNICGNRLTLAKGIEFSVGEDFFQLRQSNK